MAESETWTKVKELAGEYWQEGVGVVVGGGLGSYLLGGIGSVFGEGTAFHRGMQWIGAGLGALAGAIGMDAVFGEGKTGAAAAEAVGAGADKLKEYTGVVNGWSEENIKSLTAEEVEAMIKELPDAAEKALRETLDNLDETPGDGEINYSEILPTQAGKFKEVMQGAFK